MPNSTTAKTRLRQSKVAAARNRTIKSAVRTQVRKVREAVESGDAEAGTVQFRLAVKSLDQAAAKRAIHKNAAARTKSRLAKALKTLGA